MDEAIESTIDTDDQQQQRKKERQNIDASNWNAIPSSEDSRKAIIAE